MRGAVEDETVLLARNAEFDYNADAGPVYARRLYIKVDF